MLIHCYEPGLIEPLSNPPVKPEEVSAKDAAFLHICENGIGENFCRFGIIDQKLNQPPKFHGSLTFLR